MDPNELDRHVTRARRRLWLNRWLRLLGWTLTGGAVAFIGIVLVERLCHLGIPFFHVTGGVAGLALLGSLVALTISREDRVAAAAALDQAAGLRERVTSGLYCAGQEDPFARSVYGDAVRTAKRVTVGRHLPVRYPRSMNWACCSLLAALVVLWLMPSYDLLGVFAREQQAEKKRMALETTQAAVQQAAKRVKQLAESSKALKEIEGLDALANLDANQPVEPNALKRDAVKKLDKLSERLRQEQASARFDELGEVKKMLRRLGDARDAKNPADKLRQSLVKGDFTTALQAVKQMQEQLAKAKAEGNQAQVEAMQKKLNDLANRIEKAASQERLKRDLQVAGLKKEDVEELLENLSKKDIEAIKKALEKKGLSKEQVEKLLKKVSKTKEACAKCKGLAKSLASAAKAMKGGGDLEAGQAGEALSKAGEQLSELEMMQQEMADLEATLGELANAKSDLTGGEGEGEGQGQARDQSEGQGQGEGIGMGKQGIGRGGRAPREETKVKYKPDRVRGQQSPGAIVGELQIDGRQLKGEARERAVETVGAAAREATEAVERDRVPRQYHRVLKDYFREVQAGLEKPETPKKNP